MRGRRNLRTKVSLRQLPEAETRARFARAIANIKRDGQRNDLAIGDSEAVLAALGDGFVLLDEATDGGGRRVTALWAAGWKPFTPIILDGHATHMDLVKVGDALEKARAAVGSLGARRDYFGLIQAHNAALSASAAVDNALSLMDGLHERIEAGDTTRRPWQPPPKNAKACAFAVDFAGSK